MSDHSYELLDKDNHVIGSGTTGANGHVIITPTQPIPEGNVTAKLTIMQNTQMSQLLNRKKRLIQLRQRPCVTSDLTGKATTTDPVEVTTDPNTKVNY